MLVGVAALVEALLETLVAALVQVLFRVSLKKKGIRVAHDGEHGRRCASNANSSHELDRKVED